MKREWFKWFRLLLVAISLLAFLTFVNWYCDPANLYHDVSKPIAEALMDGKPAYISSGNVDERLLKRYIIEQMPKDVDCVLLGSSTVLGIRKEHVGTDRFFNLGVSSADYYDIMATAAMLEMNNVKPKRIILGVDHYYFCEWIYENNARSKSWRPYAEYMSQVLENTKPLLPQLDLKAQKEEQFRQLLSITYFQASVEFVKNNGSLRIERWGVVDDEYTGAYFQADGSMVYPRDYEDTTVEAALNAVASLDMEYQFGSYTHMNAKSKEQFARLVDYWKEQGIEVEFFLCPMSPALWERYDTEQYPILSEIEEFVCNMAEKYNINVIGSFNPQNVGLTKEDYYDARHIRHSKIKKYFQFY